LAVDSSGRVIAQTLTDEHADDPSQVAPLLDQVQAPISNLCADGAYDRRRVYQAIADHSPGASVLIPPRKDAVLSTEVGPPTQRDLHRQSIEQDGRLKWQKQTGYGK
ncbi:transposase, partial [Chromobacterium amazonense]|uniref:transposase n=1 Tax=Chromobacterium amazonense TaxID=1382803 RepID=UPI003F7B10B5